jgi:hypothetical protein
VLYEERLLLMIMPLSGLKKEASSCGQKGRRKSLLLLMILRLWMRLYFIIFDDAVHDSHPLAGYPFFSC